MNIANPEMKLYFDTFALVKEFVNETGSIEVKHYVAQKFIMTMPYFLRLSLQKPYCRSVVGNAPQLRIDPSQIKRARAER